MRHHILPFVVVFSLLLTACGQQHEKRENEEATNEGAPPKIQFEEVYYDFGSLKQGEKVSYVFEFKNTGGSALVIREAIPSCGCTVPRFEKEPVMPGEKGGVEVIFDSTGRRGNQYKSVILRTNTPRGDVRLTIKANVVV
jgi:hypothetical protein